MGDLLEADFLGGHLNPTLCLKMYKLQSSKIWKTASPLRQYLGCLHSAMLSVKTLQHQLSKRESMCRAHSGSFGHLQHDSGRTSLCNSAIISSSIQSISENKGVVMVLGGHSPCHVRGRVDGKCKEASCCCGCD